MWLWPRHAHARHLSRRVSWKSGWEGVQSGVPSGWRSAMSRSPRAAFSMRKPRNPRPRSAPRCSDCTSKSRSYPALPSQSCCRKSLALGSITTRTTVRSVKGVVERPRSHVSARLRFVRLTLAQSTSLSATDPGSARSSLGCWAEPPPTASRPHTLQHPCRHVHISSGSERGSRRGNGRKSSQARSVPNTHEPSPKDPRQQPMACLHDALLLYREAVVRPSLPVEVFKASIAERLSQLLGDDLPDAFFRVAGANW